MPVPALPEALRSRNPAAWLTVFGPGAIIASLTIGSGELIFSARGGALFGYDILGLFVLVCVMKWALVFATARHIVLTGAHPFERWNALPGPKGWLPIAFMMLAMISFPIWISFHAGTIGTLITHWTQPGQAATGGTHLLWGMGLLAIIVPIALRGGYHRLERIQLILVTSMLLAVMAACVFIRPDWVEWLLGFFHILPPSYPDWIHQYPTVSERPVWVELSTYVGVIGGSGYDYLAYVAYMRERQWGRAHIPSTALSNATPPANRTSNGEWPALKPWIRAPLIDCTLSFLLVLIFSAVFVACGHEILGTQQRLPEGNNLLNLQAEFVAAASPYLRPLYHIGAFLALLGTLYGTIEVAPAIAKEFVRSTGRSNPSPGATKAIRTWAIGWVGIGAFIVLAGTLVHQLSTGSASPTALILILTPANLFTGVLACGVISLLSCWTDHRFLEGPMRPPQALTLANLIAGSVFLVLGLKAYWDHSQATSYLILAATVAVAIAVARVANRSSKSPLEE